MVVSHEDIKLVFGYPSTIELSALLSQWNRDGWRHLTVAYHRKVGAVCGVVKTPPDEPE